jgi:hypothetical protein
MFRLRRRLLGSLGRLLYSHRDLMLENPALRQQLAVFKARQRLTNSFHRRRSKSRGKLFFRLVQQAVAVGPVPLDRILHPEAKIKRKSQSVGVT